MIGYGTLGLALATKSNGNEMEVCRFLLGRDGFSLTSQSSMRLNCEARLVLVAGGLFDMDASEAVRRSYAGISTTSTAMLKVFFSEFLSGRRRESWREASSLTSSV
mgnify:CR=1 FL=1